MSLVSRPSLLCFMLDLHAQDPEFFPGTAEKQLSLHEGDRARGGEAHGMQQGAVKGDIYLEGLRKHCLGGQRYPGQVVPYVR